MELWNYQAAVFQVLSLIVLFEIPSIIRRLYRVAYTPIYFMFFPLGHSDRLYAEYFAEDYFYSSSALSEKKVSQIRYRIMAIAALSMFVSAVFAPVVVGFVGGLLFDTKVFYDFVFALLAMKTVLLCYSLYNFFLTTVGRTNLARFLLPILYLVYLVVIFVFLTNTFDWTIERLLTNTVLETIQLGLSEVVFSNIWAYAIVPAVTAGIAYLIANPSIRQANLAEFDDEN